jgi:sugar phosphate isomerase/epimerase
MACQLGAFTRLWRGLEIREAIPQVAKAGYKYIGLLGSKDMPTWETPKSELQEIKKVIADNGLTFLTTWAHMPDDGNVDPFKGQLDMIAELGGKHQLMGGPWPYKTFPDELFPADELKEKNDTYFNGISACVEHAAKVGVQIVLKPHTGVSATSKECLESVQRVNHPNFRIWHDPANVSFYEGVQDDCAPVAEYVTGICVKDHSGVRAEGDFSTPGDGKTDWPGVWKVLKAADFDGPAVVEIIKAETPEECHREAVRALEFMKRTMTEAGLEVD